MSEPRVVVITGGAGGMGLASARRMAGGGRSLLLADVSSQGLAEAARSLEGCGSEVRTIASDLTERGAADALADAARGMGALGALVHTAGLSPTMASGERILDVNLVATERLLDAFLPLASAGSVAVLIASQSGHFVRGRLPEELVALLDDPLAPDLEQKITSLGMDLSPALGYSLSKLGVIRAAIRLAPAWGERGARIVSLSPGIIDTAMGRQEEASQNMMQTIIEKTPLGRKGTAEDIAGAVDFLCSEAASFVTGTDLLVDGGSTEAVLRNPTD